MKYLPLEFQSKNNQLIRIYLANLRVFGLLKWTEVLIFFFLKLFLPLRAALAAVLALDIFCRFLYLKDK